MLLRIRELTAGKFSYFIVAVISVPFALWGINYYFQGGFDPVVIEVGSTEISLSEYNASFNQKKRHLEATVDASQMPPDEVIKKDVIGTLVRGTLLLQEADEYNYHIPDAALARMIVETPDFQTDGKFDKDLYYNIIQARQQSQKNFEEGIREQLRQNQLYSVIVDSSFNLPREQKEYQRLLLQERQVRYMEFPLERYIEPDSVSNTEVFAHYQDRPELFVSSDRFRMKYLEFKLDDMLDRVTVEEDEIRGYYEDNLDFYIAPEYRTLAHILIDPTRHGEEAGKRADEIHQKLKGGADFSELAKAYSDDSLTADKGGVLPPLTHEDVEDDVEAAVFALGQGEFSEPVESSFGLQIFKLIGIEAPEKKSFEDVHDTIEEQIRRDKAESLYSESLAVAEELVYRLPRNMKEVVKRMDVLDEVKVTNILDIDEYKELFRYPQIREIVYTEWVLQDQNNSRVLEVAPGHAFSVRVDEGAYEPSRQLRYEEVESEIVEILLEKNAWVSAAAVVNDALKQLEGKNATLDELAEQQSLSLHDTDFIRRDDPQIPAISRAAFLLPEVIGSHNGVKMQLVEGYAIVELVGLRQREASQEEDEKKQEPLFAIEEFNAMLLEILERSSINIHEDRLGSDRQ